jgi:hypothetical protein
LIGSAPVSTGVDGIQKVCNRIIPVILPWTRAEYDQLLGRVIRQGSNYTQVDVFIPQIYIEKVTGDLQKELDEIGNGEMPRKPITYYETEAETEATDNTEAAAE